MGHVEIRGPSILTYGSGGVNTRVAETAHLSSENTGIIPSAYIIKYKIRRQDRLKVWTVAEKCFDACVGTRGSGTNEICFPSVEW
jgi:hypothetical protein